jgi:hypothetical protein
VPTNAWWRLECGQERLMINAVNTRGDIHVQPVLRPKFEAVKDRRDGLPPGMPWAKAVGVGRQFGCPLRLQGLADQRLPRPFVLGGHPQRTLLGAAPFGNPCASKRGRCAIETELASELPALGREERCHPINARGVCPAMVLGSPDALLTAVHTRTCIAGFGACVRF